MLTTRRYYRSRDALYDNRDLGRSRRFRTATVGPRDVRVVVSLRSALYENRMHATRILGAPAFAAYADSLGTLWASIRDLPAFGYRIAGQEHDDCAACQSLAGAAMYLPAATGRRTYEHIAEARTDEGSGTHRVIVEAVAS